MIAQLKTAHHTCERKTLKKHISTYIVNAQNFNVSTSRTPWKAGRHMRVRCSPGIGGVVASPD